MIWKDDILDVLSLAKYMIKTGFTFAGGGGML
jgi:hypothetical protein